MNRIIILSVIIVFFCIQVSGQCSNPDCGSDFAICGNTAQLNVQNATTGYWTAYSGSSLLVPAPTFSPSASSATANVSLAGELHDRQFASFVWTDNSGPCTDTVVVEFVEIPVVYAGPDKDVCGNCTQLEAVSGGFGGAWLPNGAAFDNYANLNTEACVNQYIPKTFTWLETNNANTNSLSCSDMDEVVVTFWRQPTAVILTDEVDSVACGLTFHDLHAENPGSGVTGRWWHHDPEITFPIEGNYIASITVPNYGYHDFYWIVETGPELMPGFCVDTAGPFRIHFIDEHPIHAGIDRVIFGYECQLEGTSVSETNPYTDCNYFWSSEAALFEDLNDLQTNVTVSEYGEYEFVLFSSYINMTGCTDSDTVKINFRDPIYQGIDDESVVDFKIFPNPAWDYITIQSDKNISSIQIFDISGKLLTSTDTDFDFIDVSALKQGLYRLAIYTADTVYIKNFIK